MLKIVVGGLGREIFRARFSYPMKLPNHRPDYLHTLVMTHENPLWEQRETIADILRCLVPEGWANVNSRDVISPEAGTHYWAISLELWPELASKDS